MTAEAGRERSRQPQTSAALNWKKVWERRRLDTSLGSTLLQLMAADGLDTAFGRVDEASWVRFVRRWTARLRITPQTSVFEVGCGSGAFLYDLHCSGCPVGGIDQSEALIAIARSVMPGGQFGVADAADLDARPPFDVVLSCGMFPYLSGPRHALDVVERMVAKATTAVAVLDVPDATLRREALAYRHQRAGGESAYATSYDGLEHCYYQREWLEQALARNGLIDVQAEDQNIDGYGNSPFRFNVWGFKRQE